jgi:hypothetical protein
LGLSLSKIVEWAGNPFNIKIVRSKYETVFLGFIHIFAMLDATFRKKNPLRECAFPPFCEAHDRLTKTHDRSLHCRFSLEQLRAHGSIPDNRKKDSSPRARARRNHIATARSTPTRATPATRDAHRPRSGLILDLPATSPSSPSLDSLAVRALGRV